jgi:hypothetical protein
MTLRSDHVAGGAIIVAGLLVLSISGDLPFGTWSFPGSGMMPKLICGLMIVLGAILVLRAGESAPFAEIEWKDLKHAVVVMSLTAVAVALYTTLGFIITMTLLIFSLLCFERRNIFYAAGYSVFLSVGTYYLFDVVLKSPLEQGLLGF